MLVLPEHVPNDLRLAPPGCLGQIEIPGAGKKHGEVVVFTPEQRRAVDDALGGYLANYQAVWRAGQIEDYFLFPGSKMRMLHDSGRRWTRKVRVGAMARSRDGARCLQRARGDREGGPLWKAAVGTGCERSPRTLPNRQRRVTASRTASVGGRTPRPASRSTRTGSRTSSVRRRRRSGASSGSARSQRPTGRSLPSISTRCSPRSHPSSRSSWRRNQRANGSQEKNRRDPFGPRRLQAVGTSRLPKSGRWDSNPRRPAWEGGGKTRSD